MASSRLNLKRNADIEWMLNFANPGGAGKYETCISGRETEDSAIRAMAYGQLIPATNNPHTYNGVFVDLDTQLYCSKCAKYLYDKEFPRNRTFANRRGRAYVCKRCSTK